MVRVHQHRQQSRLAAILFVTLLHMVALHRRYASPESGALLLLTESSTELEKPWAQDDPVEVPRTMNAMETAGKALNDTQGILPDEAGPKRQGSSPFLGCRHHSNCSIHFPFRVTPENVMEASTKESNAQFDQHCVQLLTQQGDKGKGRPNQDRIFSVTMDKGFVGGLFDGHGPYGHEVSEWAMSDLFGRLWPSLIDRQDDLSEEEIQQALNGSFVETDEGRVAHVYGSGSTGILIWQQERRIVLASLGDSTGLVARWNGTSAEILARTVHHKPGNPEEYKRIIAAGGGVSKSGRALFENGDCKDCKQWPLAMSRCFGDNYGKGNGALSAEPAIQVLNLPEDAANVFVVLASDGTVDYFSKRWVATAIGSSLFGKDKRSLPDQCRNMIRQSTRQWDKNHDYDYLYRDDMSLLVARLDL